MLKLSQLYTRRTRNLIVLAVLLLLTIGVLATGLFMPVQASPLAQGQDATPTPDSMQEGMMDGPMMGEGMMPGGMSMAGMGAMMDQMMAHMQSMMGTMPMSSTMSMTGASSMVGMMPMCTMMHMGGSTSMTGTMPMMGTMSMTDTMPMTGMVPMTRTMPMSGTMSMDMGSMDMGSMDMGSMDMGMMMQMMGMMQMHMGCMQMMIGAMMSGSMTSEGMMGGPMMGHTSGMDTSSDMPFDAMFIDSMIEHHQGAIDMAKMALEQAEHEELRTLAEEVIDAQTSEIEQLQSWRSEWYPDLPPTSGMQMDMGEMMLDDDESVPFDQRFMEAMISHHQGAIEMAETALDQAEHEEIRILSEEIIAAQTAEIEQMQGWLADWYSVTE